MNFQVKRLYNSYALFGILVNSESIESTKNLIKQASKNNNQLIFCTPNVNFLASSHNNKDFKSDILNCDLSVIDGKPLFWLAKLLGIPAPEKVSGSDLFESLNSENTEHPLTVFFFGGMDKSAETASEQLNALTKSGLKSVGHLNPGMGDLSSMSQIKIIDTINSSGANFLIVSLGAVKGHRWIEMNKERLTTPVISHLGAVVNFTAGTHKRSPKLLQNIGLEWLWRIYQEPYLYKRYAKDGLFLLQIIFSRFIPLVFSKLANKKKNTTFQLLNHKQLLKINGNIHNPVDPDIYEAIVDFLNNSNNENQLTLDLKGTRYIGTQFAGMLLALQAKKRLFFNKQSENSISVINLSNSVKKQLLAHGICL